MKILNLEQGSAEWKAVRCGLVTASEFDALMTPEFKPRSGEGVKTYLAQKVCEKFYGYTDSEIGSFAMSQGEVVEKIARPWYEFAYNVPVQQVGFCLNEEKRCGCSPDGILPNDEGLEIKSPQGTNHTRYLLDGVVPKQYLAQIHFSLYVSDFKAWTFVSFSRHMPALVVRVERDEAIQATIQSIMQKFNADFDAAHAKIMNMMPKGGRPD
jgi:hypothetical protein